MLMSVLSGRSRMTDIKRPDETPEEAANGTDATAGKRETDRATGSRPPPEKESNADGDVIAELGDEIGGPA
jgi:hypothetical protein